MVTPAKARVQRKSWEALPKLALSEMRLPCQGAPMPRRCKSPSIRGPRLMEPAHLVPAIR